MKRFWKNAAILAAEDGWTVALDAKPIRTPAKNPLVLPGRALAEAVAAEWNDQGAEVRPETMPLMRLASTAIDLVAKRHEVVSAEVAKYAETDLVCYRAEYPPELAQRQQALWGPLLDWAMLRYDAALVVTSGVIPTTQSPASLKSFWTAVAACTPYELAALHAATTACGSVVLGLALLEGRIEADEAFALSQLDESFEIEKWGEDAEAERRRTALREDISGAARFLKLLREARDPAPSPACGRGPG
jgi:chaperone required for assembly of F1-ATPase